jgi:hypothetical protein
MYFSRQGRIETVEIKILTIFIDSWEVLGKAEMDKSALCFGTGNTVTSPC